MNGDDKIKRSAQDRSEVRLKGLAVSRGTTIGKVICLHGRVHQFYKTKVAEAEIEIERLASAFSAADSQLRFLIASATTTSLRSAIFDTHRVVLNDPSFRSKIESNIRERSVNAEWAITSVADEYVSRLKALNDKHLRDRYVDISDIVERLLAALTQRSVQNISVRPDSIIAASEIRPSTIMEFDGVTPAGCISEHGGWTSHSFILARELGLPAVTGIGDLLRFVENGDTVIVDGYNGELIVSPSVETLESYRTNEHSRSPTAAEPDGGETVASSTRTLDGAEIKIMVNADSPRQTEKALRLGADGVGLFRSESLFSRFNSYPSEDQQFAAYSQAASIAGDAGVRIRTFDLSIGQTSPFVDGVEQNPALGLRGIRLSLREREQFATQLRAIIRSAHVGNVGITVPMVSGTREISIVREMVALIEKELDSAGVAHGKASVGVMIEVPSAVMMIDRIMPLVDYVCLGTNDLVQYLLSVDRDNDSVAEWFRSLDPAVLIAIERVIKAGRENGKPVIVCGEMAGSPFYTPLLIGLGATALSMNVHSIRDVRRLIAGIAHEEAVTLAREIRDCSTADDVETAMLAAISQNWSHLYPPDFPRVRKI
jgi:phosphotransferase system enzyme I (PtsI)